MKKAFLRNLKPGTHFFTKNHDGKVHEWILLERTVNAYLSESPANVVDLKSGKFGYIHKAFLTIVYPSNFKSNVSVKSEQMEITGSSLY